MKKRVLIIITSILVLLIVVGGGVAYLLYDQVSAYFMEETLVSQMTQELISQTGIDLGEVGRALTEEEIESFKSVLNTKETSKEASALDVGVAEAEGVQNKDIQTQSGDIEKVTQENQNVHEVGQKEQKPVTTDDLRGAVEQQAKAVARSIPNKDKSAMLNLVLSNLTSSDINYLMSLVLDGVSDSDLSEAKRVALERFDQEELKKVETYYDTYKSLLP